MMRLLPRLELMHTASWYGRRRHSRRRRALLGLVVVALWVVIVLLRFQITEPAEGILFALTVPIALGAAYYGRVGGLVIAFASTAAFGMWAVLTDPSIGSYGLVIRPLVFVTIAIGVGLVTDRLEQTRDLLQAVLEGTNDPVFVMDHDSRFMMINAAGARLMDREPHEVLGQRYEELDLDGVFDGSLFDQDVDILDGASTRTAETSVVVAGRERVYLVTKGPVRDPRGHVVGLYGIARDITERKLLHQRERDRAAASRTEYDRARSDYERLMRHRIANPLAVALGTAITLRDVEVLEASTRLKLMDALVSSLEHLERVSLSRSRQQLEEHELDAVAHPSR